MTRRFAEDTNVPVERSRAEIEALLVRYGCKDFGYRVSESVAAIQFVMQERHVRFSMTLPARNDERFTRRRIRASWRRATPEQQLAAWDQECRRLWRCLALSIKAKLEAVQSGIAEFESEFLANIIDPHTGRTVAELVRPQLAARYKGLPAPDSPLALPDAQQKDDSL